MYGEETGMEESGVGEGLSGSVDATCLQWFFSIFFSFSFILSLSIYILSLSPQQRKKKKKKKKRVYTQV